MSDFQSAHLPIFAHPLSVGMSFHRWCLLIAVPVYFTAAWFGVGYHAEDEFQQVILIAEHLRGHVEAADLPLDYHAHWRGMVLPLLCAGVFEVCEASGISDPFQLTLVLRLLTAALALWVTLGFIRSVQASLKQEDQQAFALLSYFLWFLPVLQIRFTGEAWSGLLFMRGLGMLIDPRERKAWMVGAWFGAAILFRPVAALLPLGAVAWMVVVQRVGRKRAITLIASTGTVLVLGAIVDSAAYGSPVGTLWNYALAALSGEEAERFTILPWYQYALFTLKYAVVPIGALIAVALIVLFALRPRHVLIWVLLPFLVVHSILGIKELRFLFPLAPLMPWLLMASWEALQERWPKSMARLMWMRVLFVVAVVNLIALVVGMSTPAGNGRIKLAQMVSERYVGERVLIDQLGDWRQRIPPFFLTEGCTERFTDKVIVEPKVNGPNHVVIARASLDLDRVANLERIACATPAWSHRLWDWYGLEDDHDPLVLYRVTTRAIGH